MPVNIARRSAPESQPGSAVSSPLDALAAGGTPVPSTVPETVAAAPAGEVSGASLLVAPRTGRGWTRGDQRTWLTASVAAGLARSGKWDQWLMDEPRLAGFASLEEVLEAWRRGDDRCQGVVAGLTRLGSRRGGDDDEAALAVVVLLEPGAAGLARKLSDICQLEDIHAAVWEAVKEAEPQLGRAAAYFLLRRARQRLTRPAAGLVSRLETTSLDQWLAGESWVFMSPPTSTGMGASPDQVLVHPQVDDPVDDVVDVLAWARGAGVIAEEEVELLVELLAAENAGLAREAAQRAAGERRGVGMRTIRRRRDVTEARLRSAAADYLAATG